MATYEGEVKDGNLYELKDTEGKTLRLVPESDLLALKDSRNEYERQAKESKSAADRAASEAATAVAESRQEVLKAQALVDTLKTQVTSGQASSAELESAKAELEAAKKSSEEITTTALETRRELIVHKYGVPVAVVEKKNLEELKVFEEALKAVIGSSPGNMALGGGAGATTQNLTPMERSLRAYSSSNK